MKKILFGVIALHLCLNINAQCTLDCNSDIIGNLNANCEYQLTEADAGTFNCPSGNLVIEVFDNQNVLIPNSPFVNESYIGQTLNFSVTDMNTGSSCTGNLSVIDSTPPEIECPSGEIECLGDQSPLPSVTENCPGQTQLILLQESAILLECSPQYVLMITKSFQAIDQYGNMSSCTDDLFVKRIDLNAIVWPEDRLLAGSTFVSCEESTEPMNTGYPTFNDVSLDQSFPNCNLDVQFIDNLIITGCVERIYRVWTVTELWCETTLEISHTQLIEKTDATPPMAFCLSGITLALNAEGIAELSPENINAGSYDLCGETMGLDLFPNTFDCSNIGINVVELVVYDACYNSSFCTSTIEIVDMIGTCNTDILELTEPIIADEVFCAGMVIESSSEINGNLNVEFLAPESILLNSGFEVPSSSIFNANIETCIPE